MTVAHPLRDDAAAIEALVPRLAEKGLAGLAVTPSGYLDSFPEAMVKAADELDFPLIELPQKVSFIDIIRPITGEILRLQANELLQSEEIHRQFIDTVRQGRGARLREVPELYSGLIWTGAQSIELGLADEFGSVDYVAREVIKAEDIVDFSTRESIAERFARRLGAAMAQTLLRHSAGPQLR